MNRDQIISSLYTGKNFNSCISKMEPKHLQEDLKSEVISVVCGWPEEKVVKLHKDGALEFYVVRVILNQIQSKSSPFFKKFRTPLEQLNEIDIPDDYDMVALADRQTKEALEELAMKEVDSLYWYQAEMIKVYMAVGNYRAMEKLTMIPFISCYKDIQKSISIIRNKILQPTDNRPIFSKEEQREIQRA